MLFTMPAIVFDRSSRTRPKENLLRSQATNIKVSRETGRLTDEPSDFDLSTQHVPDVERMMRGVMVACGIPKEEIERMLRERRDRADCVIN